MKNKNICFVIATFLIFFSWNVLAYPSGDFVTTWKTDASSEDPTSITLNFQYIGMMGYYEVSWECNGTYDIVYYAKHTHNYSTAGTYDVCIRSLAPLAFYAPGLTKEERAKLLEIKQWGNISWKSFREAFKDMTNVRLTTTDVPNLSQVTDMSSAFQGATNFVGNSSMNDWNTSNVIYMGKMFREARKFNSPIGNWETGKVTDMSEMFFQATVFNQDITSWDLSSVTTVKDMFFASRFNNGEAAGASGRPLTWDVKNVKNFYGMFRSDGSFNQSVGSWNTSSATTMERMFDRAYRFNQPLDNWSTSNVENMLAMFQMAYAFNQDLSHFDTSNVKDMNSMFWSAYDFNQDISSWNLSKVTTLRNILEQTSFTTENYDKLLNASSSQTVQSNVLLGAQGIYYCTAEEARNVLVSSPNNWKINDSGKRCPPGNLNLSSLTVNEHTLEVGIISAEGTGTVTYSLVSGEGSEDNSKFALDSASGLLVFLEAPDFENPTDIGDPDNNNTYSVRVRATNEAGSSEKVFVITVLDIDDVGPVIVINMGTKKAEGDINDTTFLVSDRFSIASVEVDKSSVAAAENITCAPVPGSTTTNTTFPFVNTAPSPENHLVLNCTILVKSSGKLVLRATDNAGYSTTNSTEEGYAIDTLGPTFLVANVDISTGLHTPTVLFNAVAPVGVEKYEIVYTNSSGDETTDEIDYSGEVQSIMVDLDSSETSHDVEIKSYSTAGKTTSRRITFPVEVTMNAPTIISNRTIDDTVVKITSPVEGNLIDNINVTGSASEGVVIENCVDKDGKTTAPYNTSVTCNVTGIQNTGMVEIEAEDINSSSVGKNLQKYFYDIEAPNITTSAPTKINGDNITDVAITITDNVEMYAESAKIDSSSTAEGNLVCQPCSVDRRKLNCVANVTRSGTLVIMATDKAGNSVTGSEEGFVIDREAPVVSITSNAPINNLNKSFYNLGGECTFGDGNVTISIVGQNYLAECLVDCSWSTIIDFSMQSEGNVSINVSQIDAVGNRGEAVKELFKDTIPPIVWLDDLITNVLSPEVNGGVNDCNATVQIEIEQTGQVVVATNNKDGSWTVPAGQIANLTFGEYDVKIIATDLVGNTNEVLDKFSIDTNPPQVSFNATTTRQGTYDQDCIYVEVYAFDNESEVEEIAVYLYSNNTLVGFNSDTNGFSINFTNLSYGTYYLNASAKDAAGNVNETETREIILKEIVPEEDSSSRWYYRYSRGRRPGNVTANLSGDYGKHDLNNFSYNDTMDLDDDRIGDSSLGFFSRLVRFVVGWFRRFCNWFFGLFR